VETPHDQWVVGHGLLGVEHLVEDLVVAGGREFEPLSDLDVLG